MFVSIWKRSFRSAIVPAAFMILASASASPPGPISREPRGPAKGPLRVLPENPRYFTDGSGKAVYLTGSHTWANLVDIGPGDPPPRFDFDRFLAWAEKLDHNFIRLWTWELVRWSTKANGEDKLHTAAPHPWARAGPGTALDGKPKFDLAKFDPEYFDRLRTRVKAAGDRGFYVSIMLFEGWGLQFVEDAWKSHPFHPENNVQKLGSDPKVGGKGLEIHTLGSRAVTEVQEAYVRKVIEAVNDLENVLYEISNENHPPSTPWQYHMIDFIHRYEKSKPRQHPVGMTFQYKGGKNLDLFKGPADWISPNPDGGYRDDPPAADGRKVILNDTDHLWGIGGNAQWVWKSFLRGHNPLFMDPYDGVVLGKAGDPLWDPIRRSLGAARRLADRIDLARMEPRPDLASTKYCLANPGKEYLVFLPGGGEATVDLSRTEGRLSVEWIDPVEGTVRTGEAVRGGEERAGVPRATWTGGPGPWVSSEPREPARERGNRVGEKRAFKSPSRGDAVLHLIIADT